MPGAVDKCASYSDEGRKVRDVPIDEVSDILKVPGQFVWIGLYEPDDALLRKIQEEFGLHDLAIEDAARAHQRPKLEEYGDSIFVVLRTVQCVGGETRFGETHVFVGPRYVVTVGHGDSPPYAQVRERAEKSPRLLAKGPGFVLYAIMDFVVDQYFPVVDACEDRLETLEESVFADGVTRMVTQDIYDLKRELVALKRAVAPLMEVCNRLVRYDVGLVPDEVRLYFRDVYDHVIRINETVDNLRELLTSALEANLSLVSVRQNEVMKQLAAWAAILAVPTAIAGIYGMNFEFMPELHARWGYPLTLAVIAAISGGLYARFKKAGWL